MDPALQTETLLCARQGESCCVCQFLVCFFYLRIWCARNRSISEFKIGFFVENSTVEFDGILNSEIDRFRAHQILSRIFNEESDHASKSALRNRCDIAFEKQSIPCAPDSRSGTYHCLALRVPLPPGGDWFFESEWLVLGWKPGGWGTQKPGAKGAGKFFWAFF